VSADLAIGVDVGGTKVLAGVVDTEGTVLALARRPTPSTGAADVEAAVASCVAELRAAYPSVVAVGLGAAGFVDASRSVLVFAPNLAWRQEPLREALTARVGLPVVVENDGNAAAWAEHRFGAGRGVADMCLITVGTGIGCGLVLGGALYRGGSGIAGEPGHLRLVPDGRRCGCGNRGCWEQYCSGRALAREAQEIADTAPWTARELLARAGGHWQDITGAVVSAAAVAGDAIARECFDRVGRWLGQGLADVAAVIDPSLFVVGGGVAEAGALLLDPARARFAESLTGRGWRRAAPVVPAALGPEAGLVGAADLARATGAPPPRLPLPAPSP